MTHDEFNKKIMQSLNEQQQTAVRSIKGAVLLLAVPGSGKTTVLVTRLGYMVCCENISPDNILTMTYTVAATKEMKNRFISMFGEQYAKGMEFRTINGISAKIIEYYGKYHAKDTPFELVTNEGMLNKITRDLCMQINDEYPTDSFVKDVRTYITYIKNMMLDEHEINKLEAEIKDIQKIYNEYCAILKQSKKMDYDDQMIYALSILKNSPPVLEYFQNKFRYICVDESQDTSKIQHEIIKVLAKKHNNIFMVGDEDQSIYGFRAAYPQALMSFENDYKDAKILFMEQNYRSTKQIISCANTFVSNNKFRHEKTIKDTLGTGLPVQFINAINRRAQYKYLFYKAKKSSETAAVLYRLNDSALPLIDMLEFAGVAYNCKKFDETYFSHKIIADITDIINFAYNPHDTDIFMRIYYKFTGQFTKKSAEYACTQSTITGKPILKELIHAPDIKNYVIADAITLMENLPKAINGDALHAVQFVWNDLNYSKFVIDKNLDSGKFFTLCMLAEGKPTAKDLLNRLLELKEIISNHKNSSKAKLILSTVHSSKGLEYNSVYLLDTIDGVLPSKTEFELETDEDIALYEEDRRLYYVAITRAKSKLHMFNCIGKKASFNTEVQRSCPRELVDKTDVFAELKHNLCGKTYSHKTKGKGVIIAQNSDEVLVEYESKEMQLACLEEMLINRDETIVYQTSNTFKNATSKDNFNKDTALLNAQINVGDKVEHTIFGKGTIIKIAGDIMSIQFEKNKQIKNLGLSVCLESNLLTLIN